MKTRSKKYNEFKVVSTVFHMKAHLVHVHHSRFSQNSQMKRH